MSKKKKALLIVLLIGIPASVLVVRHLNRRTVNLVGAVVIQNPDPGKELPIAGVHVIAAEGRLAQPVISDASGLFKITIRRLLLLGRRGIIVEFRHPNYQTLTLFVPVSSHITVAELVPIERPKPATEPNLPAQLIGRPVVRYTIKTAAEENVGSVAKPFEVVNQGNVPCNGAILCSPDKKWRASMGTIALDAGADNEFRFARASCIAGPCPFTKIDTSELERPGRIMHISAISWSDTATFLVEAEVVHPMISDVVRYSYPLIFGEALNFTLPPAAEGLAIQADLNGQSIVFPVGPALLLDWANCNARSNPDETRVYRCELKPGYKWAHVGA
jgi:hypothetical protein